MTNQSYPFADVSLSRRLENAEAHGNVLFVEARAKAFPDRSATWIEVAGTYAMFDGIDSPVSQTFGLGISQPISADELETIERFFLDRGTGVFHEVSPLADASTFALLNEHGYRPIEFTNVLFRPISRGLRLAVAPSEEVVVRLRTAEEETVWSETALQGWSEFSELLDFLRDM